MTDSWNYLLMQNKTNKSIANPWSQGVNIISKKTVQISEILPF